MMNRTFLLVSLVALGACSADAVGVAAAEEVDVAALVAKLHSDDYWEREQATVELAKAGAAAVPEIVRGLAGGDLEVAWRAIEVLEQQSASDEPATAEAAQTALLSLSKSPDSSIAGAADRALAGWRTVKRNEAIAKLRELGAQVSDQNNGLVIMGGGGFAAPPVIRMIRVGEARAEIALADAFDDVEEDVLEVTEVDLGAAVVSDLEAIVEGEPPAPAAVVDPDAAFDIPDAVEDPKVDVAAAEEPEEDAVEAAEDVVEEGAEVFADEGVAVEVERFDVGLARAIEFRAAAFPPGAGGMVVGEDIIDMRTESSQATMSLDRSWQGGDDGLKYAATVNNIVMLSIDGAALTDAALPHLTKMTNLSSLYVRGAAFTKDGLRKLREDRPEIMIMAMGEALVGISGDPHPRGFMVNNVVPESGAGNAGVELGDVIVSCDGQKIGSISDLTIEIFQRKIGDRVEMKVLRNDAEQTLTVTLGARQ